MRKFWAGFVCLIVVALSVAGIVYNGDIHDPSSPVYSFVARVTPADDLELAQTYGELMKKGDVKALEQISVLPVDPKFPDSIALIKSYYPPEAPTRSGPVTYTVSAATDGTQSAVVMTQSVYADGSNILLTTTIDKKVNKVRTFNFRKATAAEMATIRFDPLKANATQAFFLALATGVFVFTLVTAYACLSVPGVKWKWLWFIFIMAGITGLQFNWATQTVSLALLDIRWGAGGYFQNLYQSAIIYINLPIVAILYWLIQGRRKPAARPAVA